MKTRACPRCATLLRARRVAGVSVEARRGSSEIAMAAACYAAPEYIFTKQEHANGIGFANPWPWDDVFDKRPRPSRGNFVEPEEATLDERIRLLEKAGALCAAEIDRLLRVRRAEESESRA